jgi:hypothetical protein
MTLRHRLQAALLFIICALVLAASASIAGTAGPLPRICVRDGNFVQRGSNQRFHPRGFHYVRLRPDGAHYVFAPSLYDPNRAEAMLADLSRNGFNVVRVFIGAVETVEDGRLSPRLMANFCDFLERAERHGVYVIVVVDWVANAKRYNDIIGNTPANVESVQVHYLDQRHIAAKALYLQDFIGAIKGHNPRLLSAVFAYELENESYMDSAYKPFSESSGKFEFMGKSYDMSSAKELQELVDLASARRCNALVKAIHAVDADAMVSCSVYTFNAVGRTGPGALRTDKSPETRFPMRPLAMVKTKLSYIDIHLYSFTEEGLERDLRSIEWTKLRPACKKAGKPLFVGECGAFKSQIPTLAEAADAMTRHIGRVMDKGFAGYCYWTYDCDEQTDLYNAKMGGGEIFRALVELNTRLPSPQMTRLGRPKHAKAS